MVAAAPILLQYPAPLARTLHACNAEAAILKAKISAILLCGPKVLNILKNRIRARVGRVLRGARSPRTPRGHVE